MSVYEHLHNVLPKDIVFKIMSPYDLIRHPYPKDITLRVLKENNIPIEDYLITGDLFDTLFQYANKSIVYDAVFENDILTLERMKRFMDGEYKEYIESLIFKTILENDLFDRLYLIESIPYIYPSDEKMKVSREMMKAIVDMFPKNLELIPYICLYGDMSLLESYTRGAWYPKYRLIEYIKYIKPSFIDRFYSLLELRDNSDRNILIYNSFLNPYPEVIVDLLKKLRRDHGLERLPLLDRNLFLPSEVLDFLINTRMIDPGTFNIFIKGPLTEKLLDTMVRYGYKTSYKSLFYLSPDSGEILQRLYERGLVTEADIHAYKKRKDK